jgi:uncharacterized RmlC-like cupin family protein
MEMTPPACRVIRSGDAYVGQQGFTYLAGLTGGTAGSRGICMTLVNLPDGARAKTQLHRDIETAVYVIDGAAEMYFGSRLEERLDARATCRALVAHTAADDQAGIVLLPELDTLVNGR